jgi:hypothetical protein
MERGVTGVSFNFYPLGRCLTAGQQNIRPQQETTSTFPCLLNPDGPRTCLTNGAIWVAQRLWPAHPNDLYPAQVTKAGFLLVWHNYPEPELVLDKCKRTLIIEAEEDSGAPVLDMNCASTSTVSLIYRWNSSRLAIGPERTPLDVHFSLLGHLRETAL